MSLVKMQDIGGCRAVVRTEKDVRKIASKLRKKKHILPANNYLKKPKSDGYRGIHLVGSYETKGVGQLLIEFQIRTKIQHAWATAGEITELFTSKSIKHTQGDVKWKSFYKDLADLFDFIQSKFVSREFDFEAFDHSELSYRLKKAAPAELKRKIHALRSQERSLQVQKNFDTYANSIRIAESTLDSAKLSKGYARLHATSLNTNEPSLQITYYTEDQLKLAQEKTYDMERNIGSSESELVVLLSTQAIGGIREAYPNYFADSVLFMKLVLAITAD